MGYYCVPSFRRKRKPDALGESLHKAGPEIQRIPKQFIPDNLSAIPEAERNRSEGQPWLDLRKLSPSRHDNHPHCSQQSFQCVSKFPCSRKILSTGPHQARRLKVDKQRFDCRRKSLYRHPSSKDWTRWRIPKGLRLHHRQGPPMPPPLQHPPVARH